jgi:hypothetical protein
MGVGAFFLSYCPNFKQAWADLFKQDMPTKLIDLYGSFEFCNFNKCDLKITILKCAI